MRRAIRVNRGAECVMILLTALALWGFSFI